jgi:hypothetical protein
MEVNCKFVTLHFMWKSKISNNQDITTEEQSRVNDVCNKIKCYNEHVNAVLNLLYVYY